jgi:DNA-binding transcriptional LysR family regulator
VAEGAQLPHLETFAKAAELTSFTAAARALRITQAAVSQRIGALEKSLGARLFQRQGGRVLLTEAGRRLYDYAERILALHREARREVTGRESPPGGELVLGASSIPGEHLLPALLSGFGRKHPHVRVRASVSDSMRVLAEVERGEVSLGLVGRRADSPHLEFRFLARDRMVLIAPPGHPLTRAGPVGVKQLAEHPLVLREAGSGLRHCFEKSLERAGRSVGDLRVALELGSNEAIKEAVLRGLGVAVLSACVARKEIESGQLRAVEVSDLRCDRDIFVVQDRRRVLPLPARLFLLYLDTHPVPGLAE